MLSPQAIITGLTPDFFKHCKAPFGSYAQVHAEPEPKNDVMTSRTVGGICLGPLGNIQGTNKFLSVLTGQVIKARSFTPLPMPDDIIHAIENIAIPNTDYLENFEEPTYAVHRNKDDDYLDEDFDEIDRNEVQDILTDADKADDINENDNQEESEDDNEISEAESSENPDETSRTTYITKRGREVKLRKDIYDNYIFNQEGRTEVHDIVSPSGQTPTIRQVFGLPATQELRSEEPANDGVLSYAFTQYSLKQAFRLFPEDAKQATLAEMKQLDDMEVFQPVLKSELTQQEVIQSLNSIIFIKQKKCGRIKARACADGRPQRILYNKHDAYSPTVKTESVLLTSIIDAAEERSVGIYDIPGAFLHSKLPDIVHMKMTGAMLKCLVAVAPEKYSNFVISESGQDVIYLLLTKALYGF